MNISNTQPQWILNDVELSLACLKLKKNSALAIDTEFIRTNTFYPIPALIQIFDGSTCYLIDPLKISDTSPLRDIFIDENILKIFHSCGEDLEVFDRLLGDIPKPIFDTQVAAAFLGYGFSVGYARLVKTCFDVDIPKEETRSNWLQRPLSDSQIHYAALDVIYLHQLHKLFSDNLIDKIKSEWVTFSNQEVLAQFQELQKPESYFQRIKSAWHLSAEQQNTLNQLVLWREETARKENIPRSHLIADDLLIKIAAVNSRPCNLFDIQGLHRRFVQKYAEQINQVLAKRSPMFNSPLQNPLPREMGSLLKKLKAITENKGSALGIAPEMLARKKDFQNIAYSVLHKKPMLSGSLISWRSPIIGDSLLDAAQKWLTEHPVDNETSP